MIDKPESDHPIPTEPTDYECPGRPRGPLSTAIQVLALTAMVLAGGCAPSLNNGPRNAAEYKLFNVDDLEDMTAEEVGRVIEKVETELRIAKKLKKIIIEDDDDDDGKDLLSANKEITALEKLLHLLKKMQKAKAELEMKIAEMKASKKCLALYRELGKLENEIFSPDLKDKAKRKTLLKKRHELLAQLGRAKKNCSPR
ncbi:hypothetical protein ACFLZH_00485 [Patescibacteria group bacterium]